MPGSRCHDENVTPWLRRSAWLAAALLSPLLLALALLPLRGHVNAVAVAAILLVFSAGAFARGAWVPSLLSAASAALSFNYFFTQPYNDLSIHGVEGVETTVVLFAAIPVLGTWVGRLYGKEAARERELRKRAEQYAAELTQRQREIEQMAAELAASRRRILAVGDETRRRIERNLHDGVQQRIVTLSLMLRGVQDKVPDGLADVRADIDQVSDGLAGALEELRDLSRGLHPAILSDAGLGPALRSLARRSALPVRVEMEDTGRLADSQEVTAYYVASEAFANAAKHARASAVHILVTTADGWLIVRVSDDGVGGADASRGSGLAGLRDRVEAVGGVMALDSPAGSGTVLTVRLPLEARSPAG
jgi:signal transduction histidine kinase